MTRHRLVRCQAAVLFTEVSRRHAGGQSSEANGDPPESAVTAPWLGCSSHRRPAVRWQLRLPRGRWLDCWLEVEQGANGVIAHLSAVPSPHAFSPLPPRLCQLALEAWIAHELAALGRGAEFAACGALDRRGLSETEEQA